MSGQGGLSKLIVPFRSLFQNNRGLLLNYQQHVSITRSTRDKITSLNIPEKPKRPLTAYLRFVRDSRSEILRKNPNLKMTEIAKECSAAWASAHSSLKEKYDKEYREEMDKYASINLQYEAQLSPEQKEALRNFNTEKRDAKKKRAVRKLYKETNKPKRPMAAYMYYIQDMCKKENLKVGEVLSKYKGHWYDMSEAEKSKYIAQQENDKKRYEKEIDEWEAKMLKEGRADLIRSTSTLEAKPTRIQARKPRKALNVEKDGEKLDKSDVKPEKPKYGRVKKE